MHNPKFCPSCQSEDIAVEESPNGGVFYVGEDLDGHTEVFDGRIYMISCEDCGFTFYSNLPPL
jgi:hypothetical protein